MNIGACSPRHARALSRLFWIMRTHITRTGRKDTWSPSYSISVHRRMYSVQCSDKICFLQLRIKCGVATSCPCTHTALQAPMGTRPLRVCFWANSFAARSQLCVYIQSRVAVIVVAIINKSPTYSVFCFQGFRIKWEDHIWIWCCHKVSPNGVDVDASVVCKVSHIENWQHPTNKKI